MITAFERVNAGWRRAIKVSANERLVLMHLGTNGAMTAADLSKRVGITSAAMTTLVDRLERDDLVKRVPHPQDRRRLLVYLTKHYLTRLEALAQPLASELEAALASLPESDRAVVERFLEDTSDLLVRHAESIEAGPK